VYVDQRANAFEVSEMALADPHGSGKAAVPALVVIRRLDRHDAARLR
jgi:hypothetical protein